jgi:hypothetical protein
VLGEVEETIYVVEEDEDEEETVRVDAKLAKTFTDNTQEIGDAVRQRYVLLVPPWLFKDCNMADHPQETVLSSYPPKHHRESRIPKCCYGKDEPECLRVEELGRYPKATLQNVLESERG